MGVAFLCAYSKEPMCKTTAKERQEGVCPPACFFVTDLPSVRSLVSLPFAAAVR